MMGQPCWASSLQPAAAVPGRTSCAILGPLQSTQPLGMYLLQVSGMLCWGLVGATIEKQPRSMPFAESQGPRGNVSRSTFLPTTCQPCHQLPMTDTLLVKHASVPPPALSKP
jgi:hypothetical protein